MPPPTSSLSAEQLCKAAGLKHPYTSLPEIGYAPRAFLNALLSRGFQMQAILFLAHAIPSREGIWWAWTAARTLSPADPAASGALSAVEKWLSAPTDEHRILCRQVAERLPSGSAPAALCEAVFFTGNLAQPGAAPIPPPQFSSSKFVGACIILCACEADPRNPGPHFQASIERGLEVVRRIKLWDSSF
jgi:hypothetical protein